MLERRAGDVEVATADIVDGFIVHKECAVRVLNSAVSREDSVVWLDDGGGDTGSRVDGEFELGFLAIVGAQSLKQERAESRTSSTTKRVEDEESLKTGAVVLFVPRSLASDTLLPRVERRRGERRSTH